MDVDAAVAIAQSTVTHTACVRLVAQGDAHVIRQYGERGRAAVMELLAAGIFDDRRCLTDLGRAVAAVLAEGSR